jgi:D-glycero-alpha-D-manno-heptose-7-phosphate kinase
MLISSCPLRVSLFGGSTDNPYFVEKYGRGSVISFTSNLKTYITLHEDKMGFNTDGRKYIVNYSRREETEYIDDIQNELVRIVLNHFDVHPISVTMKSDAYSQGSGLASSSSYIISLIKCLSMYDNQDMTDIEICKLAHELELQMNPYCGYQDPYGCGIGGFKRMEFNPSGVVQYDFLSADIFRHYDMYLVFTGVTRNSKHVLKSVTENVDKISPLLDTADRAYDVLIKGDYEYFIELMRQSWKQKKLTSSSIMENSTIKEMDSILEENETVLAHRLVGAGNGGFFLTFSEKNTLKIPYESVRINVNPSGVSGMIV